MSVSGDRIKACRIEKHLTQEDVARHLGVGKQAVYKYETGMVTNIPLDNIVAMSNLFGVAPDYLAGWSDEKNLTIDSLHMIDYPDSPLSFDEIRLVEHYRSLNEKGRKVLLDMSLDLQKLYFKP